MTLLLDSSVLFELENGDAKLSHSLEQISKQHKKRPCISFISLVEFLYGYEGLAIEKKVKSKEFIWKFPVLQTTNATAVLLSALKYKYDRLGKQISMPDLFIASQALEHDLVLVTKDKDFSDIGEIKKIII